MADEPAVEESLSKTPTLVTAAGDGFFRTHFQALLNFSGETMLATEFSSVVVAVDTALRGERPEPAIPEVIKRVELMRKQSDSRRGSREVNLTVQTIDNYLVYIAEALTLVFMQRPEALKSEEQVRTADVLRHDSMEGFVAWLADEKVNRLSFKGFASIENYSEKRLGLPLVGDATVRSNLVYSIALRNLFVHKRGVVDDRFRDVLRAEGRQDTPRGERVSQPNHVEAMEATIASVEFIERSIEEKFGIPRKPFSMGLYGD